MQTKTDHQRAVRLFTLVIILTSAAGALSSSIYSNYFKEVYQITSVQRGFLEFPRELPGVLCMVIVSALTMLTDVTIGVIAQFFSCVGLVVMGALSPSYGVMMIFLFTHSLGQHLFMPINDSIALSLGREGETGTVAGKIKSRGTFAAMLTAVVVLIGFRVGFFSFSTPIIVPFLIAAGLLFAAALLLLRLRPVAPPQAPRGKRKIIVRKQYIPYYLVTLAFGCQKRIRLVYGPWLIVELLGRGADTTSMLAILSGLAASLVVPQLGKLLDRKGVRRTLVIEGVYLVAVFSALGVMAYGFSSGRIEGKGFFLILTFVLYILCDLMQQFNMVHSYLMRRIAISPAEVTQSLSVGLSVDHVLAVVASYLFGLVWAAWGPQWVFFLAAACSIILFAAVALIRDPQTQSAK
jgi:predicted MFS family arabinose efflux permease